MKRREFIFGVTAASVLPIGVAAQQPSMPVIGYLSPATASLGNERATAFVRRLRELGWIEGRTVTIEYRWAEGKTDRLPELAADLVRLKVDVIFTGATAPILAAKKATSLIPIVFALAADPLGTGLVNSLARPGGNLTGVSIQTTDLAGKRLELLRDFVPGFSRIGVLADANSPSNVLEIAEVQAAAKRLDLQVSTTIFRGTDDIALAFQTFKDRIDALYVCASPLVFVNRIRINTLASGAHFPTIHGNREYVEAGGLLSYGPNILDQFRRAAEYVDKFCAEPSPARSRSSSLPSSI